MKKEKKTYGIYHLSEKHTEFPLGKMKVRVSFTGGIITKRGVTPATYTTSDPVVQFAIERSTDFKKGFIRVVSCYPMEGEVEIGRNQEEVPSGIEIGTEGSPVVPDPETLKIESASADLENQAEYQPDHVAEEESAEEMPEEKETTLLQVEVSCKDVAKQYLEDHFNVAPAPLRTRDAIQKAAAEHGIEFVYV